MDQLNWDKGHNILLELSRSTVLLDPLWGDMLPWILMVSPGRAMVWTNPLCETKEDLDKLVGVIKAINAKSKAKIAEGGLKVDRVVLSWMLAKKDCIRQEVSADTRTYWDRHAGQHPGDDAARPGKAVETNLDVLATLTNFHYTDNKDYMINEVMKNCVVPYICKKMVVDKIITLEQSLDPEKVLQVKPSKSLVNFTFTCATEHVAGWMCCRLKDVQVQQADTVATISFKSHMHQPLQQDWVRHFHQLAIKDISTDFGINPRRNVEEVDTDSSVEIVEHLEQEGQQGLWAPRASSACR
jgi:hypothetical protein